MKQLSSYNQLRLIYAFFHVCAVVAFVFYFSWAWLALSLLVYLFLQVVGMGIGIHRYLAHRSFVTTALKRKFLIFAGTMCAMGSPISWAGVHRFHHLHADGELDPHSPHRLGLWKILLGQYNASLRVPPSLVKDLVTDPYLIWIHRRYVLLILFWFAMLSLIHWPLALFGFAVPVTFCYWATSGGIFLNHTLGYRNHDTSDLSVNSLILSIYTLGDGWHNNHHHNPNNYRHGERWWEVDSCAFLIKNVFMANQKRHN